MAKVVVKTLLSKTLDGLRFGAAILDPALPLRRRFFPDAPTASSEFMPISKALAKGIFFIYTMLA